MRFTILFSNHGSATHVQDQLLMLKLSLEAAGHEAVFGWEPSLQHINIALDCFTEDQARSLASHGERTIIVATEFVTEDTFNDMADDDKTTHYGQRRYWDERASNFRIVAAAARAVWCLDRGQLPGYRAFLNPGKVHQFPFVYLPEYAQVRHVAPARKDIDVLFTGTLTTYRRKELARIEARGLSVEILGPEAPAYLREHFVGRAKLNVHIRQSPTWRYPSNSRLYHAIMNAAPMLSERCAESSDLETFVTLAQTGALADECQRLVAGGDLLDQALTMRDRFREQRPAAEAMRRLLDATFGDRPVADSCQSQREPRTQQSGSVWSRPLAAGPDQVQRPATASSFPMAYTLKRIARGAARRILPKRHRIAVRKLLSNCSRVLARMTRKAGPPDRNPTRIPVPDPPRQFDPAALQPRATIHEHTFAKVAGPRKRISVIYNLYNKDNTLFQSLESLHIQNWKTCTAANLEIIIADDGTEDRSFVNRLPPGVLYLWQRRHGYGICRAKNAGARIANGDFLVFLDPDILVGPDYFEAMLKQFEYYGDRLVQCGYILDYHFAGCPDPRVEFGVWDYPFRPTRRFHQIAGGNLAMSRRVYNETPGFDEDLIYGGVEDLLFGYHLSRLPGTSVLFNREMEGRHIPHPPGGAHAEPERSWEVVRLKWPEFYEDYVLRGLR